MQSDDMRDGQPCDGPVKRPSRCSEGDNCIGDSGTHEDAQQGTTLKHVASLSGGRSPNTSAGSTRGTAVNYQSAGNKECGGKRHCHLIVDEQTTISDDDMVAQIADYSDTLTAPHLAPPTKKLMHWAETGGVDNTFKLPGIKLASNHLKKLFLRNCETKRNLDVIAVNEGAKLPKELWHKVCLNLDVFSIVRLGRVSRPIHDIAVDEVTADAYTRSIHELEWYRALQRGKLRHCMDTLNPFLTTFAIDIPWRHALPFYVEDLIDTIGDLFFVKIEVLRLMNFSRFQSSSLMLRNRNIVNAESHKWCLMLPLLLSRFPSLVELVLWPRAIPRPAVLPAHNELQFLDFILPYKGDYSAYEIRRLHMDQFLLTTANALLPLRFIAATLTCLHVGFDVPVDRHYDEEMSSAVGAIRALINLKSLSVRIQPFMEFGDVHVVRRQPSLKHSHLRRILQSCGQLGHVVIYNSFSASHAQCIDMLPLMPNVKVRVDATMMAIVLATVAPTKTHSKAER